MAETMIPRWTLGDRLAKARRHAGLSTYAMADALGVTRNTVTNWENGATKPKRYALDAWARACGVDADWLATGGEDAGDGAARSRCSTSSARRRLRELEAA